MKAPKFTDKDRFRLPYSSAAETSKEGYLLRRFKQYAERDRKNAEEVAVKVRRIVKRNHQS